MYNLTVDHKFYVDQRGNLHHADRSIRLHRFLTGASDSKAHSDIARLARNVGRNSIRVQYNIPKRVMNEKATWVLDYVLRGSDRVYSPAVQTLQGSRESNAKVVERFMVV